MHTIGIWSLSFLILQKNIVTFIYFQTIKKLRFIKVCGLS
jgi:hypothetical protein